MGRQPSDLEEDRTSMLKAGLFLAFFFVAVVTLANGNQTPSNEAVPRYISYGRPNSMLFMHPSRSLMDKRGQQIFMPRPNSMMNAIKGKRGFLHGSPNSFNFPIWSPPQFEDVEEPEEDEDEDLYESIEKYGKRADGNFDFFLGNRG